MSYANGTTHYNLPQTVGTDKRDWADTNQAFADVDAALYSASTAASGAASDITALDNQINGTGGIDSRLTTAENDIDNVEGAVSTLQGTVAGHTTAIADVRSDLQDNICSDKEPTATSTKAYSAGDYFYYNDILYVATDSIAIGDTIVPNTNCRATTVTNEIKDIDASEVAYDNSVSGLSATDVQAAVDELKTGLGTKADTSALANLVSKDNMLACRIDFIAAESAFCIYNTVSASLHTMLKFSATGISYLYSEDGGDTWTTSWTLPT